MSRSFNLLLSFCLMVVCLASPLQAAEPVEVIVEGIEGDVLENVKLALALPPGLVKDGKVNLLWLRRFVIQVEKNARTALEPFGYYNARVTVVQEPLADDRYRLRVLIEAGRPLRVSHLLVEVRGSGAGLEALKELIAAFPLHTGDILLQQEYERAKAELRSRAQELGYLDADYVLHEIRIAAGENSANIRLVLETGQRYQFGDVRIEGAPDYPDPFLRRYLAFTPDDVFSFVKLGQTQLNFANSERFKEVVVMPEKDSASDLRVPVLVRLKPVPRLSLRPGIGYGTDTGARFSLRYRDLNLFRKGHDFTAQLFVAEHLQGLGLRYELPGYLDIKNSTTLQLNLQREELSDYISRLVSLEAARNRSFGSGRIGTAYLKLQQEDFSIGSQNSGTRLVLPGLRFSLDNYDNQFRPSQGYRAAFDLRGTHQFIGSDTSLLQLTGEGSHLLSLPWRLSLHTRAKAGLTLFSDPLSDLPPSLRFFAGGDQSVRGYGYKSLGPRDASGKVVGGKQMLSASVELERALFQNWSLSTFYDAGNAFNDFSNVSLFQGAGIGLHYYSRVGALNLSLARQIGVEQPAFRIHFTVGFEL